MKKIFLSILLAGAMIIPGYSQFIKKGTLIGSGAFEFTSRKNSDSDDKTTQFTLLPWAGYLIADNIVVGGGLTYSHDKSKAGSGNFTSSSTTFMIGPVVRYYLDQGIFVHGNFGFGSGNSKYETTGTTTTTKYGKSAWRIGAGYAVRVTDTVLFEPIVGYGGETTKDKSADTKYSENGLFLMGSFTIFLHSTN